MAPVGRIAIVGSGIAGLACAHLLDPLHEVVLYEADDRLGGHSNTVMVDDPAVGPIGVDTGFIVHNDRNYPHLVRLLAELNVRTIDSEMSFAVTDRATGFTYRATNLDTLLADRRNLFDRRLWRMVFDIVRFHRSGRRLLETVDAETDSDRTGAATGPGTGTTRDQTIGEFLQRGRYSQDFIDLHLIPMGAAVWSADPTTFDQFPAVSLLRFLHNHGLLSIGDRPQWRTIEGGSRTYVSALTERLRGKVFLNSPVTAIERTKDGVVITAATTNTGAASTETFDQVIVATHSDQALQLLSDPTPAEKDVLGAVAYLPNRATLHTDISLLSPRPKAWAAWNYEIPDTTGADQTVGGSGHPGGLPTLTYDLTNLQRLPGSRRYLVSLNSDHRIDPSTILASFDYAHPVFDSKAIEAQGRIAEINGVGNTWFCGAWQGYGFHEDGMASAVSVSRALGATW